jgi:hypothetical protein
MQDTPNPRKPRIPGENMREHIVEKNEAKNEIKKPAGIPGITGIKKENDDIDIDYDNDYNPRFNPRSIPGKEGV